MHQVQNEVEHNVGHAECEKGRHAELESLFAMLRPGALGRGGDLDGSSHSSDDSCAYHDGCVYVRVCVCVCDWVLLECASSGAKKLRIQR